jgi:hypothetical protein
VKRHRVLWDVVEVAWKRGNEEQRSVEYNHSLPRENVGVHIDVKPLTIYSKETCTMT